MPSNNKIYMKNYMKKYNLLDKNREYKMSYYEKNKEHIKALQRKYYHQHKNNPNKSHFLQKRLNLQKKYYKEKNPNCNNYINHMSAKIDYEIKFNYGNWIIKF